MAQHLPSFSLDLVRVVSGYAVDIEQNAVPRLVFAKEFKGETALPRHAVVVLFSPGGDQWTIQQDKLTITSANGESKAAISAADNEDIQPLLQSHGRGDVVFDRDTGELLCMNASSIAFFSPESKHTHTLTHSHRWFGAMASDTSGLYVLVSDEEGVVRLMHYRNRDASTSKVLKSWGPLTLSGGQPFKIALSQENLVLLVNSSRRQVQVCPFLLFASVFACALTHLRSRFADSRQASEPATCVRHWLRISISASGGHRVRYSRTHSGHAPRLQKCEVLFNLCISLSFLFLRVSVSVFVHLSQLLYLSVYLCVCVSSSFTFSLFILLEPPQGMCSCHVRRYRSFFAVDRTDVIYTVTGYGATTNVRAVTFNP